MEQEDLKVLKLTLEELRRRVINDQDIRKMFLSHYPQLNFEDNVDDILTQLEEYALEKDFNILELSLDGIKLFFMSVLEDEEDEEEIDEDEDSYGKA